MKALIIGDSNSIFVKQYIDLVYDKSDQVVLIVEGYLNETYRKYYDEHNISLVPLFSRYRFLSKIPWLRTSLLCKFWVDDLVKKYGRFDVVHIHAVNKLHKIIAERMRKYTQKIVVTVWGTELLKRTPSQLKYLESAYKNADKITLVNDKMIASFVSTYGESYLPKICKCAAFGIGLYGLIHKYSSLKSREEICTYFKFGYPSRINVFIGHNGRPAQRHIELTNCILKLHEEAKEKIHLVYTMTYGATPEYINEVSKMAEQTGCSFTMVCGFKSEEEIALLRLSCDIMIHAQLTDAASASIRESIYAGSVVMNGRWLAYDNIPAYHSRVIEYDKVEQIPAILTDVVAHFTEYKKRFSDNFLNTAGLTDSSETKLAWQSIIRE